MLVFLHMFALFLLVTLGFYVFVSNPRSRAHQTFAAFIAFLAIWTTKDLIFWNFYPRDVAAGWWAASSFITALMMQYALVVFAWVFPENARTPRKKAAILFAPGAVLIPAAMLGLLWQRSGFDGERFVIELTPLAYAFVAYVYFVFGYGAVVLFQKYRKYSGTQEGQQVGALISGLAITGLLKTLANIAFPFFGYYELLPLSSIFVLPGVLIYAYAIFNFKLFSLETALKQFRLFPITYKVALSIASVAIASFVLFQIPIVWWAFHNGMDAEGWRRYLVFSVISALVPNLLLVLLVLRTISRPLQRITLAAVEVTKGAYGTEVDLRKSNDEIGLLADSFNEMSRKMRADIDELGRLNEQLVRTEKLAAMGTLAAGVAHEVNNPLASISSLVQIMRAAEGHSDETRERLNLISAQIERIGQVTRDMTNFARSRPAARGEIEINTVIDTALRLASFDKAFATLDIERRTAEDLPAIHADEDQLQQVFLNLFLNARDAMPDGGTLTINVTGTETEVTVEVADDGTGIDSDDVNQVFDPFFTTKPTGKGTGLGLAVCYGIVTAHGGRIEHRNNIPTGSIFTVSLPVADKNRPNHSTPVDTGLNK
ncbi:MAG: HAMP domain-containing protein [Acidobacteria bacterium]|nr:HAMP domain-containing protein [Acidobacteriota bacterium]